MAKAKKEAVVLKNKKGREKPEYPKLIKVGEHTLNERGQAVAEKVLVNSAEEEAEVLKEHGLDKEPEDKKSETKKAGWDK